MARQSQSYNVFRSLATITTVKFTLPCVALFIAHPIAFLRPAMVGAPPFASTAVETVKEACLVIADL